MAFKDAVAPDTFLSSLCVSDYLGSAQDLICYLYHSGITSEYYLLLNSWKPWVGKVSWCPGVNGAKS